MARAALHGVENSRRGLRLDGTTVRLNTVSVLGNLLLSLEETLRQLIAYPEWETQTSKIIVTIAHSTGRQRKIESEILHAISEAVNRLGLHSNNSV